MVAETPLAFTLPAGVELLRLGGAGRAGIGNGDSNLLLGNAAANRLEAGGGRDVLEGGRGDDTLLGGPGADSFVLRPGDGFDRIEDFTPGQDQLLLIGFGATVSGVRAGAMAVAGGTRIDLGGGDGVLLLGLAPAQIGPSDLVLFG